MQKAIESDITINHVVNSDATKVVVEEVSVVEDVQVPGSVPVVVDGVVVPNAVVVNVENV